MRNLASGSAVDFAPAELVGVEVETMITARNSGVRIRHRAIHIGGRESPQPQPPPADRCVFYSQTMPGERAFPSGTRCVR
jgi:hypothetical protein